jgi:hypothetical protein
MVLDAQASASEAFGGVPQRGIYTNMRTAADNVLSGKKRKVNSRFEAMGEALARISRCELLPG